MGVAMLTAVVAHEVSGFFASLLGQQSGWVAIMAALALERFKVRQMRVEPVGNGAGQYTSALAERALGMESPKNRIADERGLVRQAVQDVGQVVVDAERYNGLFLLSHVPDIVETSYDGYNEANGIGE